MSDSTPPVPPPETLVALCPHCQKAYSVRQEYVGRSTECRACHQQFVVTPRTAPVQAAPVPTGSPAETPGPTPVQPQAGALLCPVCQSPVNQGENIMRCTTCNTAHHADCWEYNKGCGLYGCKEAPETEKLQDIEIPASFWGQTEKNCPNCQKVIQAAAVRCRHCGTTFQSARPQETAEFDAQQNQKLAVVTHQRVGIALLIAAVIPCTAPFAAVVGVIWYLAKRRTIAAMPPLHATICRLAVGIALSVSMIMLVIAGVYSLFS